MEKFNLGNYINFSSIGVDWLKYRRRIQRSIARLQDRLGGKEREKADGGIAVPLPLELDGQRCVFDSRAERERERDVTRGV